MPAANFDDFCTSLCTLIGVPPPVLEPDANGVIAFTVIHRDARIAFVDRARGNQPGVLMIVEFGAAPPEKELEILRGLMEANFLMTGVGAPAFVLNPLTREISFHQSYLLSEVDVPAVYQGLATAANAVHEWNEDHFLGAATPQHTLVSKGVPFAHYA
jgi:hypothetical protein